MDGVKGVRIAQLIDVYHLVVNAIVINNELQSSAFIKNFSGVLFNYKINYTKFL